MINMEQMELFNGDIIKYKGKIGRFIGLVKHTKRYIGKQLAYIQLNKNKRLSKVSYHELDLVSTRDKTKT